MTDGRWERESHRPPGRLPYVLIGQLAVTVVAASLQFSGAIDGQAVTPIACALLLIFGLPHGTLDLELLQRRDGPGLARLLAAYLACVAAMFALWQLAAPLALLIFLAIAVEHFAEDWLAVGSRFVAYGTAVALIATPALRHRVELAAIFTTLTGSSAAATLGNLLLLVVPVAGVIAAVGVGLLWQSGARSRAIGLGAALLAEAVLPPVVGFTLFFCFVHSPQQLRESLARLQRPTREVWLRIILPLTLAALAIAAVIGAAAMRLSLDAGALRASFVTLSVLTLPHMVVPYLARRVWTGAPTEAQGAR